MNSPRATVTTHGPLSGRPYDVAVVEPQERSRQLAPHALLDA
jgi:hypothetical protein